LELVREDAEALGCVHDVEHARRILERGTSAHRQLAVRKAALDAGASEAEANIAVVDHLIEETRRGVRPAPAPHAAVAPAGGAGGASTPFDTSARRYRGRRRPSRSASSARKSARAHGR